MFLIKRFYFAVILCCVCNQILAQSVGININYLQNNYADISGVQGQTNLAINAAGNGWKFSATEPSFVFISSGDLAFPLQIHTPEYSVSNPNVGVFKVQDGAISSLHKIALSSVTPPSSENIKSVRPTLFVTLPGFDLSNPTTKITEKDIEDWEKNVADTLRFQSYSQVSQYRVWQIGWDSAFPIQKQADMLADHIKNYLATKSVSWDLVIIGYSRGGIFAHELSKRLVGNANYNKFHVLLLDPTAALGIGDVYPKVLSGGVYGYLKYDSQPFISNYIQGLTESNKNISGYNNYGLSDFFAQNLSSATDSHALFAQKWSVDMTSANGIGTALQKIFSTKDNAGGNFLVDADGSGTDFISIKINKLMSADLNADCTEQSCYFQGYTNLLLNTTSYYGYVGVDGVDIAVSTTFAAASATVRNNEIDIQASSILTDESAKVSLKNYSIGTTIKTGLVDVKTSTGISNLNVSVSIEGVNLVKVSERPLDAVIPGASLVKNSVKKLRRVFGL